MGTGRRIGAIRTLQHHQLRLDEAKCGRIGKAYLFPGARDVGKPISQNSVNRWLREAERLAEVKPQDGTLWHVYRRMWATARKDFPAHDVARAGGWAGPETLERVYQVPQEDRVSHVVHNPGQVRKVYGEDA